MRCVACVLPYQGTKQETLHFYHHSDEVILLIAMVYLPEQSSVIKLRAYILGLG